MVASDTGRYETRRLLDEHAEALRRALETARVAAIASEESALTELSRQCASEQAPVRPRPSMHVLTTAPCRFPTGARPSRPRHYTSSERAWSTPRRRSWRPRRAR
jgi:hypothetical protein